MKKLTLLSALFSVLLLTACETPPVGGEINDTYWNLTKYKQGNKTTTLDAGVNVNAIFSDKKISGMSTCNRYFGDFTAEGASLSISNIGSTKRACKAMDIEQAYLGLLAKATGYSVVDDGLVIFSEGGRLFFSKMSEEDISDIKYAEGVGRMIALFPEMEASKIPHLYPIVRVDRPGNYPYIGTLIDPSFYQYFDNETQEIWNGPSGDVMAVGQYDGHYICRVPGRYVSSDIALFRLENGVLKRSETAAWAWCDEGWCNQQDAWLQDINKDGRTDIVQHYTLTDDKGSIREERMTVLLQNENGVFEAADNYELDKANYKMAGI